MSSVEQHEVSLAFIFIIALFNDINIYCNRSGGRGVTTFVLKYILRFNNY